MSITCPVCDEIDFDYHFTVLGKQFMRCHGCGCVAVDGLGANMDRVSGETDPEATSRYMDALQHRGYRHGPLLVAACADLAPATYAGAIVIDRLQTETAPGEFLDTIHSALRPGAPLLIVVPDIDGRPPGFPRREDRWYFDVATIQLLLLRHGFHKILVRTHNHRLCVTALQAARGARPKCSIIIAAFNESQTFPVLMEALLRKEIPGADREIIVVESNSTDGTRELAQRYQAHPDIKLVLQERPRGKGYAIREGLRQATGDVVLIQDADLEYDLDDYDAVLAPILFHRALFVLGTRHGGARKMRRFAQQKGLAAVLNFGHAFFATLINVLYGQNMTDPFTMFKVFRRDCLFGLEFHCNRFDFDHELVIKLVRKGYKPLEVPVNYSSRSFREGKKVRLFRDPFTWLWVDLKLRVTRLFPKDVA